VANYSAALNEIRTAQRLDPTSQVINARLGTVLHFQHRYPEATDAMHRALDLDSTNKMAKGNLALVLAQQGHYAEAIAIAPTDVRLQAGLYVGYLGYIYGRAGRRADAMATLHRLEALGRERYITPEAYAFVAIGLGDSTTALDWLERGYREHSFYLVFLNDPIYDPLRGHPRFQKIVRDVGVRIPPIPDQNSRR
jgi:tetratricopeptide (TPR) repeat protein